MKGPTDRIEEIADRHGVAPSGMVVACNKQMKIGEVMVVGSFRFVVREALTREEFDRRCKANRDRRIEDERRLGFRMDGSEGQGSFVADLEGSKARNAEYADEPTADQKYFYAVSRLGGRSGAGR